MPYTKDKLERKYIPFLVSTPITNLGHDYCKDSDGNDKEVKCEVCKDENSFDRELGVGVTLYFKILKQLGIMFVLFTFLSIPSFILC
jgi:hypothetical protein